MTDKNNNNQNSTDHQAICSSAPDSGVRDQSRRHFLGASGVAITAALTGTFAGRFVNTASAEEAVHDKAVAVPVDVDLTAIPGDIDVVPFDMELAEYVSTLTPEEVHAYFNQPIVARWAHEVEGTFDDIDQSRVIGTFLRGVVVTPAETGEMTGVSTKAMQSGCTPWQWNGYRYCGINGYCYQQMVRTCNGVRQFQTVWCGYCW